MDKALKSYTDALEAKWLEERHITTYKKLNQELGCSMMKKWMCISQLPYHADDTHIHKHAVLRNEHLYCLSCTPSTDCEKCGEDTRLWIGKWGEDKGSTYCFNCEFNETDTPQ